MDQIYPVSLTVVWIRSTHFHSLWFGSDLPAFIEGWFGSDLPTFTDCGLDQICLLSLSVVWILDQPDIYTDCSINQIYPLSLTGLDQIYPLSLTVVWIRYTHFHSLWFGSDLPGIYTDWFGSDLPTITDCGLDQLYPL